MLELSKIFFAYTEFIPHGHCYLWKPELVELHLLSDCLIALAYYSIPITLVYFVRKRQDLPFNQVFLLFGTFIIACGTSHIMEVWTLWYPTYWLSGCVKAITAIASLYTAIEIIPMVPKALALPSPAQLEAANRELEREIGERKQIEEALKESQTKYKTLFEIFPIGISITDEVGQVVEVNPASEKILGISSSEHTARKYDASEWVCIRLNKTPMPPQEFASVRALTEKRVVENVEMGIVKPNGETTWISVTASPIPLPGYGVAIAYVDITKRQLAKEALRQSESTLRSFFNSSSMMMGIVELYDNDILHLSDNLESAKFFGRTPEEMQNRFSSDMGSSQATRQLWMNHYQKANDLQAPVRFEYIQETPTGSKWFSVSVCPIAIGPNGRPRFSYIVEDISDRKQSEAVLQQALSEAETASIAKSRFLSNMSHELRTPLNAILGFSQLMARSHSLCPKDKEQLQIINRSGEHLLNLINDILSMSKIEAGQITLNENSFDLFELLNDIQKMLQFKASVKNLNFIFERSADIPQYVRTDESKLRQVLINLLENAIKFTNKGGVILRVSSETGDLQLKTKSFLSPIANPQYQIKFAVEDTGPGMEQQEIATLFEPFFQTETGRQSMQGTGLGLAISREYVRLMGGNITVNSQVGKGTSFIFDVVVSKTTIDDNKISSTSKRVIGLQPNQPTYRILVVDDIDESRLLLVKLLEPLGFQVYQAVNGSDALALWSTWEPHLIWMDMRMPVMNGYEVTRQIKATNKGPSTVIIALTASAFEEERSQILSAGCDDFVRKPFQEAVLFDIMARHLGVRYIYEEENHLVSPQPAATFKQLTAEDLSVMPPEWIEQLHHAVLCANDEIILDLIEQIPEKESSLAQVLTDLVNNFRLDMLLELSQQFVNTQL
ncbi:MULTISPECIES: PAS domain-containing hybrid sensor histidine kinase/response regulator [Nostocales]|uniref:Circadian input-output histidine kinase CikA n=3 Tax=Nostocales TaxID=1161 RepID=A0A8S9TDM7_9CYAN|nr:PAS domain-containing hybrid sensor histidine kinase/response regulator [Tolypothrix bouteillei]KAF3889742.1 response regulator [Tolypothrix bouteillei VB521301]